MTNNINLTQIFEKLAESLDISPSDYNRAVRSYTAVGNWLEDGYKKGDYPHSTRKPDIYPQGSINLGTIVRPIRNGKESDFDIDLVCQLASSQKLLTPSEVKKQVGDCLKSNKLYKDKLDEEGKRCWTLTYAESEGIGFHMDILPCVPDNETVKKFYNGEIVITHKDNGYCWNPSNPKGYAEWFRKKNEIIANFSFNQKQLIFEKSVNSQSNRLLFASVEDVPEQLVRTPLQRAIQLMKRHRDIAFADNKEYKPISIIITTLAASLYQNEGDTLSALLAIIDGISLHSDLLKNKFASLNERIASLKLISRSPNGEWEIQNPVHSEENFADRWHEDEHVRAKAFFQWVNKIKADIDNIPHGKGIKELAEYLKRIFGEEIVKNAFAGWGDALLNQRKAGQLIMESGTGLLGSKGTITTKEHNFHG